jgi:hypothetical protein
MNNIFFLAVICSMLVGYQSSAQVYNWADDEESEEPLRLDELGGLVVGLNLGFYQANPNTASIYGGYGFDRDGARLNFGQSWLNQAIQGNPEFRRRTSDAVGLADGEWIFDESDMPAEMRFRPSFMWGGHFRYLFNPDFGVFVEVNGTNPVTVGEFTIQTPALNPIGQVGSLQRFQIRGEEQRLIFTLGASKVLGRKERERQGKSTSILPIVDFGLNSTFSRFEENLINLGDLVGPVDLTVFFQQQGIAIDEARILTGVGIGGFASGGIQIHLGGDIMIDVLYRASLEQVRLGEWNERGFQHVFILRALWTRF